MKNSRKEYVSRVNDFVIFNSQTSFYSFLNILRIVDYYNYVIDSRYTKKTHQFEFLNIYLRKVVTLHQAEVKITNYGLHKSDSTGLYRALALNMTIETFQPKDIILKQGAINNKVFFIVQGIVEIIDEKADYEFYNYEATGKL